MVPILHVPYRSGVLFGRVVAGPFVVAQDMRSPMSHFLPSSAQVRSTEEKPNATMKVLRNIKVVPIG